MASVVPDYSKVMANVVPDYSVMLRRVVPDYSKVLSSVVPDYSETLRSVMFQQTFPDYSQILPLNRTELRRDYLQSLPDAEDAAERWVAEEVGPEVAGAAAVPRHDLATFVRGLTPQQRKELAARLAAAISTILGLTAAAATQNLVGLVAALLALATALHSIKAFVEDARDDGLNR
ncbi:MAG: hypothetical protein WD689_02380 [Gaiellaceae bacterium]